jgi:Ras-related protein Rab-7A
MEGECPLCTVILIGDSGVGKTSIIRRLSHNAFSESVTPTVGCPGYLPHEIMIGDQIVQLQLWDTAGQETYRSLGSLLYHQAKCCVIVFALDDPKSFESLDSWYQSFSDVAGDGVPVYLVGNKQDSPIPMVGNPQVEEWAASHGCGSFLTSALSGYGISEVFTQISQDFLLKYRKLLANVLAPAGSRSPSCC